MSEEEKKAIEFMEYYKDVVYKIPFKTILNLIEKQQKEIEKLTRLNSAYKTNYDSKVLKEERKNKKILEGYISKDKIRTKIKEIEKDELMQKLDFGQIKFTLKVLNELLEEK